MPRRNLLSLLLPLVALALLWPVAAQQSPSVPVVLISIDGLKPDYVLEADKHGLKIPHLRRLMVEGAYATGVVSALPTVTYPNHTTMVTGVSPAKHGIVANTPFDPFDKNMGGWYWYAEDIKVPTLWDVATKAGMITANVDWPVTVGAKIVYNIVQYWRASTPDDRKLTRALSTPGLLTEAEQVVGPYPIGYDYTVEADRQRSRFVTYILTSKKPRFMTVYFSGLDEEQHSSGPYSKQAFAGLEEIDQLVGRVREAAESIGNGRAVICVVSDHGFLPSDKEVCLNAAFRQAGLIQVDEKGKLKSWRAYAWTSGGSAAIMLNNSNDVEMVRAVLQRLADDPGSGVHRLLDQAAGRQLGGFPEAAFVIGVKAGYRLSGSLEGPVIRPGKPGGTHGYLPELREMDASFFLAGPGIPSGRNLGRIDMRDVAPTLAALLGVALPAAEGRNLLQTK